MEVDKVRKLIIKAQISKALDQILDWSAKNDDALHTQAIMLSSRFNGLERDARMGILTAENANINRNQITQSLLWVVGEIAKHPKYTPPNNTAAKGDTHQPAPGGNTPQGKKLFISYAREDSKYKEHLEKHLYPLSKRGLLDTWSDSNIQAGQSWSSEIETQLKEASIIILIVSSDFLASKYIQDFEMKWTQRSYEENQTIIVPIIARPCFWQNEFFAQFTAFPKDPNSNQLIPISKLEDQDTAYFEIAKQLSRVLEKP
jgi:hypothetical protein